MGYLQQVFEAADEENRRAILSLAEPRPGGRLLDLGCGAGAMTVRLRETTGVSEVHGVELVDELVSAARERGVEVTVADLGGQLPFEDASFDVVHSNQVIEHLPATDGFMREIRRVLRPDGYALVSTNNLSSWHNVALLAAGRQPPPCHVSDEVMVGSLGAFEDRPVSDLPLQTHLRVFTGRALAGLAAHHGLRADRLEASGYYPLPPPLARRMARVDPRHAAYLVHRYVVDGA